jgi:hypothetical protein
VGTKTGFYLDAFSGWQGQETVVIEHGVEGLDPLRVHIAVAHDPAVLLQWLLHYSACRCSEDAVEPLAGVHVHVAQQLLPGDGLGVHHVRLQRPPHLKRSVERRVA